jgi:hypothetical protein
MDIVFWHRLDVPGHDIARLERRGDGWALAGTAVFCEERQPCTLDYLVTCDAGWRTSSARVRGSIGDREIDLTVSADPQRRWYLDGAECPVVAGCLDIDLGFTPATNLLPIRRLSLAVGDAADVRSAWLPFPSTEFELLRQVYRREGETTYHYESGGGVFVRRMEVNAAGFVTSYPGLWEAECVVTSR